MTVQMSFNPNTTADADKRMAAALEHIARALGAMYATQQETAQELKELTKHIKSKLK